MEFESSSWRGVLDTTLCGKVWLLAACLWFSPGPPVSSINKYDHHDIAEIYKKKWYRCTNLCQPGKITIINQEKISKKKTKKQRKL